MITRNEIQKNRDTLYVFGDNIEHRGFGGQAKEARGEPNTIGLPTKWRPTNEASSFFYDNQIKDIKPKLDYVFNMIECEIKTSGRKVIFFPNIGRGLARLQETAPEILGYIETKIERIKKGEP